MQLAMGRAPILSWRPVAGSKHIRATGNAGVAFFYYI